MINNKPSVRPQTARVSYYLLSDDGTFPNNGKLPLLIYGTALDPQQPDLAAAFEALFTANRWPAAWRGGVFSMHHYHSTAHEVLGIYGGSAKVQFGGEHGPVLAVERGDVVVIPAGVAHKNRGASSDFAAVGAYPRDQRPDLNYGTTGERPEVDNHIAGLGLPTDPVFGATGPLVERWRSPR